MNAPIAISKQTKRAAGFAALVAALLTAGGTLALADHYAQAARDADTYLAGNPPQRAAVAAPSREANNAAVADYS